MYILYASENVSIKPLDRIAELVWDTKNGEIPDDGMDNLVELWGSEYDSLFATSLAQTGVKSEKIDLKEIEGYQLARCLEFSRATTKAGLRLGWKKILQGNYAADVLEEKKKSFWELFDKNWVNCCITASKAAAFRAELESMCSPTNDSGDRD